MVFGTQTEIGSGVREWHNTALVVNSSGVAGEYYKARPVHFFNDGLPGKSFEPIETGIGAIGTPICFDCDYTEIIRRMTSNGAEFFAIPSFDSKSWSLTQHLQHSALFPLRAAENGRWIVLAASSGVSQIIDHHGNVRKSLGAMKEGVIVGEIERRTGMTFYTVLGWLFPWILMIASATSVCIVLYRRFHP